MPADLLTVGFGLFVWWAGTVVVFLLGRLPPRLNKINSALAAVIYGLSLTGVLITQNAVAAGHTQSALPYLLFVLAVVVWGVLEYSYFSGWITGPDKIVCPANGSLWVRFKAGVRTSLYHELTVIVTGIALLIGDLINGAPGVGTGSYLILWIMRWSAKLNLFLGVRNFNADLLPHPMRYLDSYVRRAPMNPLFPVSMSIALTALIVLIEQSLLHHADSFLRPGLILMATLLFLAIIEHLLLMVPLSDRILWSWAAHGTKTK